MIRLYALQKMITHLPMVDTISDLRIFPSKKIIDVTYQTNRIRLIEPEQEGGYLQVFELRGDLNEPELIITDISQRIEGYLNNTR